MINNNRSMIWLESELCICVNFQQNILAFVLIVLIWKIFVSYEYHHHHHRYYDSTVDTIQTQWRFVHCKNNAAKKNIYYDQKKNQQTMKCNGAFDASTAINSSIICVCVCVCSRKKNRTQKNKCARPTKPRRLFLSFFFGFFHMCVCVCGWWIDPIQIRFYIRM